MSWLLRLLRLLRLIAIRSPCGNCVGACARATNKNSRASPMTSRRWPTGCLPAGSTRGPRAESTGVTWIPVFAWLERRGFTVYLVDARHAKSVSGRKSDVLDCQWLQQLMSHGLLAGAYRPGGEIGAVRAVMRQRTMLPRMQASHVQHMQKALTQMNLKTAVGRVDFWEK